MTLNPEVIGSFVEPGYYDELARLRRDEPVREYTPNAWTVARYDDVRAISRDPQQFSSTRGVLLNDPMRYGKQIQGSVLHMDPCSPRSSRAPRSTSSTRSRRRSRCW
jgi:cytochrome P450